MFEDDSMLDDDGRSGFETADGTLAREGRNKK